MSQSLKEFLTDQQADTDTILQATRYYVAQRTNHLSPEKMRQQLIEATGDVNEVNAALNTLENDPILDENACLVLLSLAWEEPGEVERIKKAFEAAKTALPVIELAILAIVVMYGMFQIGSRGGKKLQKKITRTKPDGSFEEEETTEWWGPIGPLKAIGSLLHSGNQQSDESNKGE